MTTPTNSSNRYLFETFSDRERLYTQFDLFKGEFNKRFEELLILGRLSNDPATATWRLLDAGCGEGLYCADIIEKYPQVELVGVDIDPEAITTASMFVGPRGNAHFFTHDLNSPFPVEWSDGDVNVSAANFDLIIAVLALIHTKSGSNSLANLVNVLKPGGVVMTIDTTTDFISFPHPSVERLSQLLMEAGNRAANFSFGDIHVKTFEQLGLQSIKSVPFALRFGGESHAGQRMFSLTMSTFEAARTGIVERARVVSGEEFDRHVERAKTETTTAQEGLVSFLLTMGQKPL